MNLPDAAVATSPATPPSLLQRFAASRFGQALIALLMAAGLTWLSFRLLPALLRFWDAALLHLLSWLPLSDAMAGRMSLELPLWGEFETPAIQLWLAAADSQAWFGNLGGAALLFLLARLLRPALRSVVRALAGFHIATLLLQAASPLDYDVAQHTHHLAVISIGLLLSLPLVMAATHYIVERSHERRLLATLMIAAFLVLSLPLKLLAHAALLQFMSPLAMPTLFLVFGPAFDILCVSALYAWAITWRHHAG